MLYNIGIIEVDVSDRHIPLVVFAIGSVLLGSIIAVFVGRIIIRPVENISNAFDELSHGNFDIRVSENEKLSEMKETARHFNAMVYELSHIETLRSDFIANVSHEFKTPIAAVEGYAMLLQNPNISKEKQAHYLEIILENSRRLSNLSGNILLLSKLDNQQFVFEKTQYRLDEQIRRCILTLENKWSEKNVEFNIEMPSAVFYGGEDILEQVWLNIIDNAVNHSPQDGIITVILNSEPGEIAVKISDNGDGMAENVKKHIFEKFYQGDTSRKSEGNGLGLALVKRIVDLCDGRITVESAPEKGATFTVFLPNKNM